MVLKNKSNLLVPEDRELFLGKAVWVTAVESDRPRAGRVEGPKDVKQSALAASRWSHDRDGLAGIQAKTDVRKYTQRSSCSGILLGYVVDFKQGGSSVTFHYRQQIGLAAFSATLLNTSTARAPIDAAE
jgi:hypothetical protein